MNAWLVVTAVAVGATACSPRTEVRQYDLTGQVLGVRRELKEIVIKHDDIPGFMPGMTMPFRVREAKWLDSVVPGALVRARLVLDENGPYLSEVHPTGRMAPLPETYTVPTVLDPPLEPGALVPDVTLMDHTGRPFTIRSMRGAPFAVTFTYTRCPLPTYCPAQDRRFAELQRAIRERPDLAGSRLLSISIDPDYDRPDVLRRHAIALGADEAVWRFATGEREDILRFGSNFALSVMVEGTDPADLVHSVRMAVIDSENRLVRRYDGTEWRVTDVLQDLAAAR